MSKDINTNELTELLENNDVVLVDFHASWCGPCKALAPTIDKLSEDNQKAKIVKMNVDDNKEKALELGIRGVPTLIFFKKGQIAHRIVGAQPMGVLQSKINELLS